MTSEGGLHEPRPSVAEERIDGLLHRVSARRREAIAESMRRPLRTEILRTGYIVSCILIDLILVPIALTEMFGRPGFFLSVLVIIPLVYLEHRLYDSWFRRKQSG